MSTIASAPAGSRNKAPEPHARRPHGTLLRILHQDDASPHSAVTPLRPRVTTAAAPPLRSATLIGCSPLMRMTQLALVLVLVLLCGLVHLQYSLLPSTNVMRQWRQRWDPASAPQHEHGIDMRGVLPTGTVSRTADKWSEYECIAWREASACVNQATMEKQQQQQSRGCDERISVSQHQKGGFCELRHSRTGEHKRVLVSRPSCEDNSNKSDSTLARADATAHFRCADFHTLLTFADRAIAFELDPSFSFGKCRQALIDDQVSINQIRYASSRKIPFERGIAIVHRSSSVVVESESELTQVYKQIEKLRSIGSALPIELWLRISYESETPKSQALLQRMVKTQGVYLRQVRHRKKKTRGQQDASTSDAQFAKAHAALHSAFDKVLVLDLQGLATTIGHGNPAHLFTVSAFVDTGALFWQVKLPTDVKEPANLLVRTLFGLESSNSAVFFHQDTGRMLIDRRRNRKALNTLLFYFVHRGELEVLEVVNMANDLYQLAWASTNSLFHTVPAS